MNWKALIRDLIETGLTQQQIAQACGTGQSHISALARGSRKSPGWELGERILRLHAERLRAGQRHDAEMVAERAGV